jgi:hypothetical protein
MSALMVRLLESVLLLALLACESDEKKMERLQTDATIAGFEDSQPGTADQT